MQCIAEIFVMFKFKKRTKNMYQYDLARIFIFILKYLFLYLLKISLLC